MDVIDNIPPELLKTMNSVGEVIAGRLPENAGFALLVFDFGHGGCMNYISNTDRESMIAVLRELANHMEAQLPDKVHCLVGGNTLCGLTGPTTSWSEQAPGRHSWVRKEKWKINENPDAVEGEHFVWCDACDDAQRCQVCGGLLGPMDGDSICRYCGL